MASASMRLTQRATRVAAPRVLGSEHRESGLLARFLLAFPPRTPKRWTQDTVSQAQLDRMSDVFQRLYSLEPDKNEEGDPTPHQIGMTEEAAQRWGEFYDSHNVEQCDQTGELAAAWSKLEEYAARLALVIHFVRWAAEDPDLKDEDLLDECSIEAGVTLVTWFKNEVERVYARMSESEEDHDHRQLVEWIQGKGGSVTVREAHNGRREFRKSEDAKNALQDLVDAGFGKLEKTPPKPQGGRRSLVFQLNPLSTVDKTAVGSNDGFTVVDRLNPPSTVDKAPASSNDGFAVVDSKRTYI